MTLDEAIEYLENHSNNSEIGKECYVLTGWLKELRQLKNGDIGKIHAALHHAYLFVKNIDKHSHSQSAITGEWCMACYGVENILSELSHVLFTLNNRSDSKPVN